MPRLNSILSQAQTHARVLLKEKTPSAYSYHNLGHSQQVAEFVAVLFNHFNFHDSHLNILQTAAWFHDTGFVKSYDQHEKYSVQIVKEHLASSIPGFAMDWIIRLIFSTKLEHQPQDIYEMILRDADLSYLGLPKFESNSNKLNQEWQNVFNRKFEEKELLQKQIDFIENHNYHSSAARRLLEAKKKENLNWLKQQLRDQDFRR